jgi:hypothetical protein
MQCPCQRPVAQGSKEGAADGTSGPACAARQRVQRIAQAQQRDRDVPPASRCRPAATARRRLIV